MHASAGGKSVCGGESFADDDLVCLPGSDGSPLAEDYGVDRGLATLGQREDVADYRLVDIRDLQGHVRDDARLDASDSGNPFDRGSDRLRRATHRREDVGESVSLVVFLSGLGERSQDTECHHRCPDAAGDDEDDHCCLAANPPQIAHRFPVEDLHGPTTRKARPPCDDACSCARP